MKTKLILPLFYVLYLLILLEATAFLSTVILKDQIAFKSDYIRPSQLKTNDFHPTLGWTSRSRRLKPGGFISCFGDSFTYGDDVDHHQAWVNLLSDNFIKASNYGVGAYGVDQAYLRSQLQLKNNSKVFLLSFISENIKRNLNNYRPFYLPASKVFYIKPRFIKKENKIELLPSPIKSRKDLKKLYSFEYLKKIGAQDYFYHDSNPPDKNFPYTRLLFNQSFWNQLLNIITNKQHSLNDHNLWNIPEALKIQDSILSRFIKETKEHDKLPIIMHLPSKDEISNFLRFKKIPQSITHTKKFCKDLNIICWFPLENHKLWEPHDIESLFSKNFHYSPLGNKKIFIFVKSKINELKKQKLWPSKE